ncbi:hypothetical protein KIN20_024318 [Parelaphostrongylus tenuis]|uniref:GIY-YIG domain-containing protein n=1 Tax=Parelaphostrongylus tenuis TaxID=148309 RepID=A0AAD5N824_PARTN|nr:hypothetical protein KIN20_024318 [Parelaphostrongylus tenuis]
MEAFDWVEESRSIPLVKGESNNEVRKSWARKFVSDPRSSTPTIEADLKTLLLFSQIYKAKIFVITHVANSLGTASTTVCLRLTIVKYDLGDGREGNRMSAGTICLISCTTCDEGYIGEAERPLWIRIKEHLDGKANSKASEPLRAHIVENHEDTDFDVAKNSRSFMDKPQKTRNYLQKRIPEPNK